MGFNQLRARALVAIATAALFVSVGFASLASAAVDITKAAVVLVDMQYGFYDRGGVRGTRELETLVEKQQALLTWAVAEDVPVLVFEYNGFRETDSRLTDILKGTAVKTMTITKFDDNGFTSPSRRAAVDYLRSHNVETIIIAGINGAYCVKSTAKGAISAGFSVVTAPDIVGNINQNPPIYPNNTWFFRNTAFEVKANLFEILN